MSEEKAPVKKYNESTADFIAEALPMVAIHRTRFELEHIWLAQHPGTARKVYTVLAELYRLEDVGTQTAELEITILKELLNDILPEGTGPQEVLGVLEDEEEQYWVEKLGKMASVDILTLGKIQPATMEIITNLPTNIMYRTVRETLIKVKQLNAEIQNIEQALTSGQTE